MLNIIIPTKAQLYIFKWSYGHYGYNLPVVILLSVQRNSNPYVDAEKASHAVKVVLIVGHRNHLRDDVLLSPVGAKFLNLEKVTKFNVDKNYFIWLHTIKMIT